MLKHYFLLSLFGLMASTATAQITVQRGVKWDAKTNILLNQSRATRATRATAEPTTAKFIISLNTADATATADSIRLLGGEATVINDQTLTAKLPLTIVKRVAELQNVRSINASKKLRLLNSTTRGLSNVDAVHSGTGLETPYTGKGVIVGVIDGGFQFRHSAFLDDNGNPRALAVWDHIKEGSEATTTIPDGPDSDTECGGHGTHVAGIAASSRHAGNPYYGMAPEADILMGATTLEDDNILENAKWITDFATEQGKPWVINMSFGGQSGPHDGTTDYDQTMNKFCQAGGILVAAMGNSGTEKIHTQATLSKGEVKTLLFSNSSEVVSCEIWTNIADGNQHFDVNIFYYDASTGDTTQIDGEDERFADLIGGDGEIDANNLKEHYIIQTYMQKLAQAINADNPEQIYFGISIEALDDASFHAWSNYEEATFISKGGYGIEGDSDYLVGNGAASIPRAIAVGAYNGAGSWQTASTGVEQSRLYGKMYEVSGFSSPGPSLGTDVKPTVCAPGANIISAINRYVGVGSEETFSKGAKELVCAVDPATGAVLSDYSAADETTNDFYGAYSGTSMATPVVTGIVALWLQANPNLTPEDIVEIIRTTAKRDEYIGTDTEWDAKSGYGKIDAYEGLKAALKLADPTAINTTTDPALLYTEPVTLNKTADTWRILFNAAVERADISVAALNGTTAYRRTLTDVRAGDETSLDLTTLASGVYVVHIATPHATVVRKVVRP